MIHSTWWLIVNCKWMTSPYNCGWKRSVMFRDEYLKQTGACLPRIDCQYTTATHGSLHDNSSFYSAAGYTFKKNNEHKNLWVAALTCNMLHNVTCPCRKQGRKEGSETVRVNVNEPSVCNLLLSIVLTLPPHRRSTDQCTLLTLSRLQIKL